MMPRLTASVLAAFVAYCVFWYTGKIEGDFAFLLFLVTLVTGIYYAAEKIYFLPKRRAAAENLAQREKQRLAELQARGIPADNSAEQIQQAHDNLLRQPWWLDWTAGLFPVILAVFIIRSFIFEPFKIPSGSMIPTLYIGDMILVNKYIYGLRLPVFNTRLSRGNPVERGDVVVFRYPMKPSVDYIKRVVGLPGDDVIYDRKHLTINGKAVPETTAADFFDESSAMYFRQFEERIGAQPHRVIRDDSRPTYVPGSVYRFELSEHCRYEVERFRCTVPEGHYLMLGDNRDNSLDSRYWGFVREDQLVGKAFFIWMNFSHPGRIGFFH